MLTRLGVSEWAKGPKATQKEIEHTSHQHAYQAGRVRAGKRAQSNLKRNRAHFTPACLPGWACPSGQKGPKQLKKKSSALHTSMLTRLGVSERAKGPKAT